MSKKKPKPKPKKQKPKKKKKRYAMHPSMKLIYGIAHSAINDVEYQLSHVEPSILNNQAMYKRINGVTIYLKELYDAMCEDIK